MLLYTSAGISNDVPMALHMRRPDDPTIAIQFGEERITLDFYDVESLERLRDLAAEGAQRLHAVIERNDRPASGLAAPGETS